MIQTRRFAVCVLILATGCGVPNGSALDQEAPLLDQVTTDNAIRVLSTCLHRCSTTGGRGPLVQYRLEHTGAFNGMEWIGFRRIVYDATGLDHWVNLEFRGIKEIKVDDEGGGSGARRVRIRGAFPMGISGATLGMLADLVEIKCPDVETAQKFVQAVESLRME